MTATSARPVGRPRNPQLGRAILAAAEQQLGELGYARMSLESVAAAAGTTVPSVRRRFGSKAALAEAVIRSLRVAGLPTPAGPPRARALAILENFHRNLLRDNAMAVLGTLLAEERRHPGLLETFRTRLAGPRRAMLHRALADGITAGELPGSADPDVLVNLLIGSFYARYIATSELPENWPHRALGSVWPDQTSGTPRHVTPQPLPSAPRFRTTGHANRQSENARRSCSGRCAQGPSPRPQWTVSRGPGDGTVHASLSERALPVLDRLNGSRPRMPCIF